MSTFIDIHIVQNIAPSCLNRDDTGAPKDCQFGGTRRARISSQCMKRAARLHFASAGLLSPEELATRTRNLVALIAERLTQQGHDNADDAIVNALGAIELSVKARAEKSPQTEYLLFIANAGIDLLAEVIIGNRTELASGKISTGLKKEIASCIGSANAVDVALFGRMLADQKALNVDAAAQVAHTLGANRVDRESDFFTAVDDWTLDDEADSGMLGSVEFNSSCHYRFATVNLDLLINNLCDDNELALKGVAAFIRSSVMAIPSGKQNTFAAHNLPSTVVIGIHNSQPVSLANALEKPVWHGEHPEGLTAATVARLQQHADLMAKSYGLELNLRAMDTTGVWTGRIAPTLDDLINGVIAEIS